MNEEQRQKFEKAQAIIGYEFKDPQVLLSAITHPSANEGRSIRFSYERLEFLGDSVLGGIVANAAFNEFRQLDEGGLTRIKVSLVSGSSLAEVAEGLGFADVIVFGSSEQGTGRRGLHSALENVYEAVVAALFIDGGLEAAERFVERTLIEQRMSIELAKEPENPKSALQEKLQEDGITPTYRLVETQGPPHDRTFVAQVFAGDQGLAQGPHEEGGREPGGQEHLGAFGRVLRIGPDRRRARRARHRATAGQGREGYRAGTSHHRQGFRTAASQGPEGRIACCRAYPGRAQEVREAPA